MDQGIPETEGGARRNNGPRHTHKYAENSQTRNLLKQMANTILFEITTGKPVSDHAQTPTHTQSTQRSLFQSAHASPLSRGNRPNPAELNEEDKMRRVLGSQFDNTSSSQNAIPVSTLSPLFYRPSGRDVTSRIHHLYSLSLRTKIRIDFLAINVYNLVYLHQPTYS